MKLPAIGKRVTVVDYPDGRLSIRYNGIQLAHRTFDKIQQVATKERSPTASGWARY